MSAKRLGLVVGVAWVAGLAVILLGPGGITGPEDGGQTGAFILALAVFVGCIPALWYLLATRPTERARARKKQGVKWMVERGLSIVEMVERAEAAMKLPRCPVDSDHRMAVWIRAQEPTLISCDECDGGRFEWRTAEEWIEHASKGAKNG